MGVRFSVRLFSSRAKTSPVMVTRRAAIFNVGGIVIWGMVIGGMRLVIR